ncbi:MAG: integrase arm-type DNA-binding domain-containing protein [Burkholderiaceae bacterium]
MAKHQAESQKLGVSAPEAAPSKARAIRGGLSDAACRTAAARDKPYKLSDAGGLYLLVQPTGAKLWRLKYRHAGREKLLAFGPYTPTSGGIGMGVSLKEARERRDEAKRKLREGTDPSTARRDAKADAKRDADNSLRVVALEWIAKQAPAWSASHLARVRSFLGAEIFPALGARSITSISAPELLACIEAIEKRGALETARKTLQFCGQLWRYAMRTRPEVLGNPADALRGALTRKKNKPYRHLTFGKVGGFLFRLGGYGSTGTVHALRLLMLTATRPGELRFARWGEFDLSAPGAEAWAIPAERMKMERRHLVPLSRQAVQVLRDLAQVSNTDPGALLFRGLVDSTKPISDATMNGALKRLGADSTSHGFRHLFSTTANERLMGHPDVIERCLAHEHADTVRGTYNRAEMIQERRALLQAWADLLDAEEAAARAKENAAAK